MGYKKINAIDLLAHFEHRPRDYSRIADHLHAASNLSGLTHLAGIARRVRQDCRTDESLLAMIKLNLMNLPNPLELAIFGDSGLLHEQRALLPRTETKSRTS
ncbi:hypothetical protein ASD04_13160 [Devosia sp. Root436]|jgi:hypothetical protein|uniref:hypothetical protein n=1 Tax=Devosia sp. Root436 TaxID=1736537 RepID=UPI0006FFD442|nr:hypothetical protein [Devosia sp. Root436]KQX35719.1 hypothetical protein ASD04_13160 [Devosia sp. Root436]